jgi:TrmH RNA methyltransferase
MSKGFTKRYYGLHCCFAIVESRPKAVRRAFISKKVQALCNPLIEWCEKKKIPFKITDDEELTRVAATEHHEGIVIEAESVRQPSLTDVVKDFKQRKEALVVYLDGVENPHNLGAAIRTCAFFGVDGMIVSAREMKELSPASCRVAEGGAEDLPVALVSANADVVGAFKGAGFSALATTPHGGDSLFSVKWPKKSLLIFGAEGPGLTEDALRLADTKVCIPRSKGARIESLNVASAVAVCVAVARGGKR